MIQKVGSEGKSGDRWLSQPRDELWYEIVPIRLDLSRDWSCDFIILQLPFLLDASSNEHVKIEIMALVKKTS